MRILNKLKSDKKQKFFYELNKPLYINGDYAIYKEFNKSYIYTFKNIAINNLAGLNKKHIDNLVNGERPEGKFTSEHLLFDLALKSKEKGLALI